MKDTGLCRTRRNSTGFARRFGGRWHADTATDRLAACSMRGAGRYLPVVGLPGPVGKVISQISDNCRIFVSACGWSSWTGGESNIVRPTWDLFRRALASRLELLVTLTESLHLRFDRTVGAGT